MLRTSKAPQEPSNSNQEDGSNLKRTSYVLKVTLVAAIYCFVSISLVFLNKIMMSSEGASIPAPLFITWYQCVLTAASVWFLGFIGKGRSKENFFSQFPSQKYDLKVAKEVMPLSVVFVSMVAFNNLCLKLVEVSFYNVARSLTICFNVVLTFLVLGEKTSTRTLLTLLLVFIGFFVGTDGEINLSLTGTVFGVLSSVFVSLNSIYTKKLLPQVESDEWKLAFYNNVNACFFFLPLMILFGEVRVLREYALLLRSPFFWSVMTVAGVFGFLIGIISVIQIKLTSALTHNMVGTAKAALQTLLALWIWQNPITIQGLAGVALVLVGSGFYAIVRSNEGKAASPPISSPPLALPLVQSSEFVKTNVFVTKIDLEEGLQEDRVESDGEENGFVRITLGGGVGSKSPGGDVELDVLKKQKD